jgi:hypothetical protein
MKHQKVRVHRMKHQNVREKVSVKTIRTGLLDASTTSTLWVVDDADADVPYKKH